MNTKKKSILPMILAVILTVLSLTPVTSEAVFAANSVYDDIDGFRYLIDLVDGTAVVIGKAEGNTEEYITIPASVVYKSQTYSVSIIQSNAFQNDPDIKQVTVSDGVTTIGSDAFDGCSNLERILLPGSVTTIGANCFGGTAFYNNNNNWEDGGLYLDLDLGSSGRCLLVGDGNVKDGTVLIADGAFQSKDSLTSVSIPASVIRIGDSAFYNCGSLQQVNFAENSSLKEIGRFAFVFCSSLTSVSIPSSVNTIGPNAFDGSGLENIVLPEGLEVIKNLFRDCINLKEVTIPSTVTEIREESFSGCNNLTTIHFGGSKSQWAAITGGGKPEIEPSDYGKYDVTFVDGIGNTLEIQAVPLDEGAKWPENPTREGYIFWGWDPADFYWIRGRDLTVTALWWEEAAASKIDGTDISWALTADGELTIGGSGEIPEIPDGSYWRSDPDKVVSVKIGADVTKIGDSAFRDCHELKSFEIVNGSRLTSIGSEAFKGCTSLKTLNLPADLTDISENAFDSAPDLKIFLPEPKCASAKPVTDANGIYFVTGSESFALRYDGTSVSLYYYDGKEETVTLPDYVNSIAVWAFGKCKTVKEVRIPLSVRTIESKVFDECPLTKVYYDGTKTQWGEINIDKNNPELECAPIYCTGASGETEIIPVDLSGAEMTVEPTEVTYTGKPFTPEPTVRIGGRTLTKDVDYTLSYAANTDAGKATVTANGIGEYCNSQKAGFIIKKAKQRISAKVKPSTVAAGKNAKISVTGQKTKLSYKTGNKSIATVDKNGKVTAKSAGTVTITVTAKQTKNYDSAEDKVTIKVNPKATTLTKAAGKSKSAVISWKKGSGIDGYQIQYSTSSSFKSPKSTSVKGALKITTTIRGLKKGNYYFRIRTYKTVSGKKYYSAWSTSKKANVK